MKTTPLTDDEIMALLMAEFKDTFKLGQALTPTQVALASWRAAQAHDSYAKVGRWLMKHIDRVQLFWDRGDPQRLERIKLDCKASVLTSPNGGSLRALVMRDISLAADNFPEAP